jgi:virulence factor Mce-like protein
MLVLMVLAVWLVWAFFNQAFTDYDEVTLTGPRSGLSLPSNADVKLRGMIVGEVRETEFEDGQVKLTLGMNPQLIDKVPAGVTARIIPKTLFGEKYIDLVPPEGPASGSLRAGDTISNAVVPVEFEKFFNDIYPVLTAVPPEKVGATLTALADSLDGRGESLGETLVLANDYLTKINPETKQAADDIVEFGQVADTYASQMDNFGQLLENSSEVSRTVVDIDDDLADFFDETTSLSQVLERLFKGIGKSWIATAHNSLQPLGVLREYSAMFPCLLRGTEALTEEHVDDVMENGTLHIQLEIISPQPKKYGSGARGALERPVIPAETTVEGEALVQPENHSFIDNVPALGKVCDQLNAYAAGDGPYDHTNPFPPIPARFWKLMGIQNSHNGKLGSEADYPRAPAVSNLDGIDSPDQRDVLNRMTAGLAGVKSSEVPDVASLLISPVVRGAGVSVR